MNTTPQSPREKAERIDKLAIEQSKFARRIVEQMRSTIPILLDAGRKHSAEPLQELLFQYDALEQEIEAIVHTDPRNIALAMIERRTRFMAHG